jgi:hypothetical protein
LIKPFLSTPLLPCSHLKLTVSLLITPPWLCSIRPPLNCSLHSVQLSRRPAVSRYMFTPTFLIFFPHYNPSSIAITPRTKQKPSMSTRGVDTEGA